ncbi:MAG: class III extradiol ring-cleavage dioxygenase [Gammaproteobacteria bacterium]|jgi:aromatic ring-opening dioxygenase catalytic subunit (LigB family)
MTGKPVNTALFISHGGGPLPLLGDAAHHEMVEVLQRAVTRLPKPSAIVVVSAHWEASRPSVTAAANPPLVYDYFGFPEESYHIQYPALGHPVLAREIVNLLKEGGFDAALDEQRGFDHGLFVPLKIMYPEADIPCVQLSLIRGLNPEQHVRMGECLSALTGDNVLILGSGFSFHNMRAFFSTATNEQQAMNESFEHWLMETCSSESITEEERRQRLLHWDQAPGARYCHPRQEHLLPLHVCYGFARSPASEVFAFNIMGKKASAYRW